MSAALTGVSTVAASNEARPAMVNTFMIFLPFVPVAVRPLVELGCNHVPDCATTLSSRIGQRVVRRAISGNMAATRSKGGTPMTKMPIIRDRLGLGSVVFALALSTLPTLPAAAQ